MIHLVRKTLRSINERARTFRARCDPAFREWQSQHARRLLKFKDIHRNEGCFIIGNGPSLNTLDLSLLNNYHTFGLNKIYLLFTRLELHLSYYVAVNPYVIQQSKKQIERLSCPSFIAFNSQGVRAPLKDLEPIHFIMTHGRVDSFQGNLMKPLWEGATVTYMALQIAYYMGFSRIFLVGVDHSYTVTGKPGETQILKGKDTNHFSEEYFADQEWQLPDLKRSEEAYRIADIYFQKHGRRIYDATTGGKLGVFPKITFDEALQCCSKKQEK